jgi:hypothetical protein
MSEVEKAVNTLVQALKIDKDYYNAWKANIAMSFYDSWVNHPALDLHSISNAAADSFLQNLCMDREK